MTFLDGRQEVYQRKVAILDKTCGLFEVSAQLPSTTTETELGFYYYRLSVRVATKRKYPAGQILETTLESWNKTPVKHFTETPIFAKFREFFCNILSKIVFLENFSTFTGKISAMKSLLKEGCKRPVCHFIRKDSGVVVFLRLLRYL